MAFQHFNSTPNASCPAPGAGWAILSLRYVVSLSSPMTSKASTADVSLCVFPTLTSNLSSRFIYLHDLSTWTSNGHLRFNMTGLPHPSCLPAGVPRLINSNTFNPGDRVQTLHTSLSLSFVITCLWSISKSC